MGVRHQRQEGLPVERLRDGDNRENGDGQDDVQEDAEERGLVRRIASAQLIVVTIPY